MKKIVFATNNANKLAEVRQLLPDYEVVGLSDIGCDDDIDETETTFAGNASLKSNYITDKYGLDCFSDDSGLEVKALNNAPGVYSARYAGEPVNHNKNIEKLLAEMQGVEDRSAQFVTVICLNLEGKQYFFRGNVTGKILQERTGDGGFGYDPVFVPDGYSKSFAEMDMYKKSRISHRGRAVKKLIAFLNHLPESE